MHSQPYMPKPTILWSHVRSCSTAFERAFIQHPDTQAVHEPLRPLIYDAADFIIYPPSPPTSPESSISDLSSASSASNNIWYDIKRQDIFEILSQNCIPIVDPDTRELRSEAPDGGHEGKKKKTIFIKDMAQSIFRPEVLQALKPGNAAVRSPKKGTAVYVVPKTYEDGPPSNPTFLPVRLLKRFTHTFLIRDPAKAVPSMFKAMHEQTQGNYNPEVAAARINHAELRLLYQFISDPRSEFNTCQEGGALDGVKYIPQPQPPPLIDARDLLEDPESCLAAYCHLVGIPFHPAMLTWSSGSVEAWDKLPWKHFFHSAENSTGFTRDRREKSDLEATRKAVEQLVPSGGQFKEIRIKDVIEMTKPDYEFLFARRTIKVF